MSVMLDKIYAGLPTLPDSAEDFLIFRENKPIRVHKFDNLPDSGNFLSIECDIKNLPDYKMLMLAALYMM